MKKTLMVSMLSLAMIGSSMSAMAADRGWGDSRGSNNHAQPQQMHQQNNGPRSNADRGMQNGPMNNGPRGFDSRNEGPRKDGPRGNDSRDYDSRNYAWQRGGKVPNAYFHDRYYVENWHNHPGMYEPPRGYRWLNIDGDYVLAAVATGIISAILWGR